MIARDLRRRLGILGAALFLLSACGGLTPSGATPVPTLGTTPATAAPTARIAPTAAATPQAAALQPGTFAINEQARSTSLRAVVLTVRSATVDERGLTLRVSFQNTDTRTLSVSGGASGRDATLTDGAGQRVKPSAVSPELASGIAPQGGFTGGAANVGEITFPAPTGAGPYSFTFPTYTPVTLRFETPLAAADAAPIAPGTYAVNAELRSQRQALQPIALRVSAVTATAETLTFEIGFANTDQRRGYSLTGGSISGKDARLLDAEQVAQAPQSVSASLERGIAPQEGWTPGQVYTGTLTFARPERGTQVRLTFPEYDALTLELSGGQAVAQVTSASGGAPAPTATPRPEDTATAELDALLAQTSAAVVSGDLNAYLAVFDPAARTEQQAIFERVRQLPVVSYTLALAPDARVRANVPSQTLDVQLSYALRGIDPSNTFTHPLRANVTRDGTSWRITELRADKLPPFWLRDALTVRETLHFLIIARPSAADRLDAFASEVETAYQDLAGRGLPLENRYVAYFADTREDFADLTGRNAQRTLGIAVARYELNGEQIIATSRAFIINGAAFDGPEALSGAERQTTITHELVHLALSRESRPFTPPWLAEGAAVYYAGQNTPELRAALLASDQLEQITLPKLTTSQTLGQHDPLGRSVGLEYALSGETFAYLVKTFGEPKTLEFYRSYTAVSGAEVFRQLPQFGGSFATNAAMGQISAKVTEEAVQRLFGRSVAQLDADVKAAIRAG